MFSQQQVLLSAEAPRSMRSTRSRRPRSASVDATGRGPRADAFETDPRPRFGRATGRYHHRLQVVDGGCLAWRVHAGGGGDRCEEARRPRRDSEQLNSLTNVVSRARLASMRPRRLICASWQPQQNAAKPKCAQRSRQFTNAPNSKTFIQRSRSWDREFDDGAMRRAERAHQTRSQSPSLPTRTTSLILLRRRSTIT